MNASAVRQAQVAGRGIQQRPPLANVHRLAGATTNAAAKLLGARMLNLASAELETIPCPTCGARIEVRGALQREVVERTTKHVQEEMRRLTSAHVARDADLTARETRLAQVELEVDARVAERLGRERADLEDRTKAAARAEVQMEIETSRRDAADKAQRLAEYQQRELELRGEKRRLEGEKERLTLEVARRLEVERSNIRDEALRQADEDHRLKDAEKDSKLQDALRMNEELRRRLQQGSQQAQGEVLESTLEDLLRAQFPLDVIEPVAKGVRGADMIQRVYTRSGQFCGAILWESKNTKNWSDAWIEKLRDDQRDAKADLAVIVSIAIPKDVSGCAFRDGVWIVDGRAALGLATALRQGVVDVAIAKRAVAGKNQAVDVLFGYLTGPEFRHRAEAVVKTLVDMEADLREERRVASRRWAKREKQITRAAESMSSIYGDLQGLLGPSMRSIPALETTDPVVQSESGEATSGVRRVV